MDNNHIATKFSRENGFDYSIRSKDNWKGEPMYVAISNPDIHGKMPCIGYPHYIIIEDKKPRFATNDEIRKIMGLTTLPVGFVQRLEI